MPQPPVILNNTPLVALWQIECWDILRELFGEVLIPAAVHAEFLAVDAVSRNEALARANWINVATLADAKLALVFTSLDTGEAEVLALALETGARLVVLDERKARRMAYRLGLPLTGTIGVILLAKQRGLINRIGPLLEQLIENGLFVDSELVAEALRLADEMP